MNDRQRKDERKDREGTDSDEGNVDSPVKTLTTPTMVTESKVLFVVGTHLRGNSGNIVAPTRKNVAHDLIGALCHRYSRFLCPSLPNSTICPEIFQTIR